MRFRSFWSFTEGGRHDLTPSEWFEMASKSTMRRV